MNDKLLLAVDLGTTTLVGQLLDCAGVVRASASMFNPQSRFGADVIRRMEAALDGAAAELRLALWQGIEALLDELLRQCDGRREDIVAAAAAGNPAISTLLRGGDVRPLLFPPHRPEDKGAALLRHECLPVALFLFPLVSGYVGGDLLAVVYAHPDCEPGTFFVDIGTNGEMALYNGAQWWVTSVAAGPAFEGGNISCGMVAAPGAVTDVTLDGDRLALTVRGGGSASGLCGSGLVAAIAAARAGGLIAGDGTIADPDDIDTNLARYVCEDGAGRALCLYRDARTMLRISQEDIRQFQLAKGAVYAGAECLLERAAITVDELQRVIITGALGFSMNEAALRRVGLLPPPMLDKVEFCDGGVSAGLRRFLLNANGAAEVAALARQLCPYPLSGTPAFEQAFVAALNFPE